MAEQSAENLFFLNWTPPWNLALKWKHRPHHCSFSLSSYLTIFLSINTLSRKHVTTFLALNTLFHAFTQIMATNTWRITSHHLTRSTAYLSHDLPFPFSQKKSKTMSLQRYTNPRNNTRFNSVRFNRQAQNHISTDPPTEPPSRLPFISFILLFSAV